MHREMRNHIEDVLAGSKAQARAPHVVQQHIDECRECREEIDGMQQQATLLRELRAPADMEVEPRPGFYARVLQRIEAEGPVSIWNLFIESAFGRRIAVASLALALLLGIYVVSSERAAQDPIVASQQTPAGPSVGLRDVGVSPVVDTVVVDEDAPGRVITQMDQSADSQASADAVLANLVTYHEQ